MDLLATIIELELSLLSPEVRQSRAQLERLIADNFLEFGASGIRYGKAQRLVQLPVQQVATYRSQDFELRLLAPDVTQLIYRATIEQPDQSTILYSHRCSIWRCNNGSWQMEFHQGTNCDPFARELG